ncbi:sigma-70 family RNA polymerase sigma factor [Pseudonocardia petroleophila]|uniref:Sigma-70 family RNA polymerase sigma factor n=1 Tax=Pseudonocardia petroleophila TaxID=37331 RepID=A0A7G7MLL2_9PSEU|nr:sigma-70 family RNA polymerase sigma factor [Pseudonocardia petroleophila]QNG53673.1 sigma-70 family RNA polymerase sigma factor [Pseudonocardia petroleophila]
MTAEEPADLLRRVAAGCPGAWEDLIRRYGSLVRARTTAYRLQEADAHDVAQTTWLRLAENLDRIHTPGHLAGWLAAVAAHECQRVARDRTRVVVSDDAALPAPEWESGPEQAAVDGDVRRAVAGAIAGLPPRRRALLAALFAEDRRPYAQIAHDLGVPVGSLGPTRARLLRVLRRTLADSGIAA